MNLYPFEQTVARGASHDETIENIDIGGPSMVRSAAKNQARVAVVTDPRDYDDEGSTITLAEFFESRAAAMASANFSSGKRWEIMGSVSMA